MLYGRRLTQEERLLRTQARVHSARFAPKANQFACVDCGKPAQENDHHKGYAREHWMSVEPVCRPCHQAREKRRVEECRFRTHDCRKWRDAKERRVLEHAATMLPVYAEVAGKSITEVINMAIAQERLETAA